VHGAVIEGDLDRASRSARLLRQSSRFIKTRWRHKSERGPLSISPESAQHLAGNRADRTSGKQVRQN